MNDIFEKVANVDTSNPEAVKEAVVCFLQQLQENGQSSQMKWLDTLQDILDRFPKYCMSHRSVIETYVSQYLDSDMPCFVIEAAKCEHLLLQVRPINDKNATPKMSWRDQLVILCDAAHDLLGDIFVQDVYVNQSTMSKEKINTPILAMLYDRRPVNLDREMTKESALCRKLHNIFIFIQAMLLEIYPVPKLVKPQLILDVIIRALNLTSGDTKHLAEYRVMEVKLQALRILDALVESLGPNLIPFSPLIFRLLMQTLRWNPDPGDADKTVRIQAYSSLAVWFSVLKTHRFEPGRGTKTCSFEDELMKHILEDFVTPKHTVHINININPTKNLSKKAKRKLHKAQLQDSNLAAKMNHETQNKSPIQNDNLAIAALDCLEAFLVACGLFTKPSTHKLLQEQIIRECLEIDRFGAVRGLRLCQVLEALRQSTAVGPTQYCLDIYSKLTNSKFNEISRFCSQALLNIRMHLHCSPPSLNFTSLPTSEAPPTKHSMSERNRAALQELLGRDGLSSDEDKNADDATDSDESSEGESENTDADDEHDSVELLEEVNENPPPEKRPNHNENSQNTDEQENVSIEISDTETETHDLTENLNTSNDDIQILDIDSTDNNKIVTLKQTKQATQSIHDMVTQMPNNEVIDAVDGSQNSEHSIEIAYDYPSTGQETVIIFEEIETANLPSTNETDDVELDCGQPMKCSQETIPITNGVNNMDVEIMVNIDNKEGEVENRTEAPKVMAADGEMSVEDMMADFVDEVTEDPPLVNT